MATEKLKTINIKGKNYVQVNERVKAFRSNPEWQGWSLVTKVHELTADTCTMEAQIIEPDGRVIANGFAREVRMDNTSMVNKTSYVENCETSAWGRALGNLGIGTDESICSAQELLFALEAEKAQKATAGTKPTAAVQTPTPRPKAPQTQNDAEITPAPVVPGVANSDRQLIDAYYADIDAAENMDQLTKTMQSAKARSASIYDTLRPFANAKAAKFNGNGKSA